MSVMAMTLPDRITLHTTVGDIPAHTEMPLNRHHCVLMALCHDMPESLAGDLTPDDPVTPAEKHQREAVRCPLCSIPHIIIVHLLLL